MSVQDVIDYLGQLGVSANVCENFRRNNVDRASLGLFSMEHMSAMGLSAGLFDQVVSWAKSSAVSMHGFAANGVATSATVRNGIDEVASYETEYTTVRMPKVSYEDVVIPYQVPKPKTVVETVVEYRDRVVEKVVHVDRPYEVIKEVEKVVTVTNAEDEVLRQQISAKDRELSELRQQLTLAKSKVEYRDRVTTKEVQVMLDIRNL